jgi:hypothetical protein
MECGSKVSEVFDERETKLTNFPDFNIPNTTAGSGRIGTFCGLVEWKLLLANVWYRVATHL